MDINDILPRLKGVKRSGQGKWIARCCAHDDRSPSLSIRDVGNGRILFNCFVGCSYESIIAALGIDPQRRRGPYIPPTPIRQAIPDKPIDAQAIWQRWFDATDFQHLDGLGMSLGVDTDALRAIGCAWAPPHSAWSFPMKDATGKVIGIRLRNEDGHKWAVKGSKSGLFIPSEHHVSDGTLHLVEGVTDLAAAMTIGLYAIGRAACLGQENLILDFIRMQKVRRLVILADLDDPGIRGARKLQDMLPIPSVMTLLPAKDVREFVNNGGTPNMIQSIVKDLVWSRPRERAA